MNPRSTDSANRTSKAMTRLSDETRNKLKTISTATVATALYKRGFRTQCIQDVHPLGPDQPTLVGEAFTLRHMPAREDLNQLSVFRDRAHPQRKAVEDCPPGAVLVMDSRKDARAASAGAILVTRLMQRGVAGVITDGGFRDSAEIAKLGFPAYHHRPGAPQIFAACGTLRSGKSCQCSSPMSAGDRSGRQSRNDPVANRIGTVGFSSASGIGRGTQSGQYQCRQLHRKAAFGRPRQSSRRQGPGAA